MSIREDLEACETILATMLAVHMADEESVQACLKLVRRACAELEDPATDDTADDETAATGDLRERFPDIEKEKQSAMDRAMGVSAVHSEGCAYENGIQTLGVQHVVGK